MRFALAMLLWPLSVQAANLYVDTTNSAASDSNPGTLLLPWKTIQKAATTASAGDVVTIQPGEYNEFIIPSVSGTAGSPIVFQGIRGTDGSWKTIIDPSTNFSTGWVAAPEIGTGVYKQTGMIFEAQELSINHKDVGYLYTLGSLDLSGVFIETGHPTTGAEIMLLPSNYVYTNGQSHLGRQFWDGVEALYASTNASTTYLRLRDGSDPNGLNIRASGNWDDHVSIGAVVKPIWNINGKSYLVISNLLMRGAWTEVYTHGSAHHISISSNYMANGYARVVLSATANSTVSYNSMTLDYYGYASPGAWLTNTPNDTLYCLCKLLMSQYGSEQDHGVFLNNAGNSNVVCFNHIYSGIGNGLELQSSTIATNTLIYGNRVEGFPSCGFFSDYGEIGTLVYDNVFANAEANVRWGSMDRTAETARSVYIYRNTFWNPPGVGDNIFMFWAGSTPGCWPNYWVYHNSFAGGRSAFYPNEAGPANGGMPNCFFLNNICDSQFYQYMNLAWWTNAALMGGFDYNLITPVTYPSSSPAAWIGAHNLSPASNEWSIVTEPSFHLLAGSKAINSALDTTQSFTINGTNYSALPQDAAVKIGTAWDMGALESGATARVKTGHAGHIKGK